MLDSKTFWALVDRSGGADACWPWTGQVDKRYGYGRYRPGRTEGYRAHRVAYEVTFGATPLCVLHECDNRLCCNPKHLHAGTRTQNSEEMVRRGRSASGERNAASKLTSVQVSEARRRVSAGGTKAAVARDLGVTWLTIHRLVEGVTWSQEAVC